MRGKLRKKVKGYKFKPWQFALVFAVIGGLGIALTQAATNNYFIEPETSTLSGGSTVVADAGASGGSAVRFTAPSGGGTVPNPLKIMPLGDSLTQGGVNGGLGGQDPATINGYRLALWNLLSDYTIDYVGPYQLGNSSLSDHDSAGESGACIKTSPCGGSTMYPLTAGWLNTYKPDLVIMQGGENDFSDHNLTEAQASANMQSWIQLVWTTLPNAKIIVSGAPWHETYDSLVHTYVNGLQSQGKPIRWVPYGDDIGRVDLTHPSAAGYITWANELAPMVRQLYPK